MPPKKLSNFMTRQPPKPMMGSIRFSSLDDKDDDDDADYLMLDVPPPLSSSVPDTKSVGDHREMEPVRAKISPERPKAPPSYTEPKSKELVESTEKQHTRDTVSSDSCESNTPTCESIDMDKGSASNSLEAGEGKSEAMTSGHRTLNCAGDKEDGKGSDVSAADIHALLDSFHKNPSRRERRKPSEVGKAKPTSRVTREKSPTPPLPVIHPTVPPPLDSIEPSCDGASSDDLKEEGKSHTKTEPPEHRKVSSTSSEPSPEKEKSSSVTTSPQKKRLVGSSRFGNAESEPELSGVEPVVQIASVVRQRSQTALPVTAAPSSPLSADKKPDSLDLHKSTEHKMKKARPAPVGPTDFRTKVVGAIVLLLILYFLPISSFFMGFLWGLAGAGGLCWLYIFLTSRSSPPVEEKLPRLRDLPSPSIPEIVDERENHRVHRGWMNEMTLYNPETYHINMTYSVWVTLEGTKLRLQRPKQNVPRRAMWNEKTSAPSFVHQRIFDLLHAQITLEPPGLVQKRIWSKKYPICVMLATSRSSGVVKSTSSPSLQQQAKPRSQTTKEGFEMMGRDELKSQTFYLFARTCREKEEWFRRFQAASMGVPLNISLAQLVKTYLTADQSGTREESETPTKGHEPLLVVYLRHMAKFMPADWLIRACESQTRLNVNYISCEPQVLWLNAFLGRAFWDFFREESWVTAVRTKIQAKLKKIHLPYFIDELTVVDMDLGTELPAIRRMGRPYLDQRGLWIELDVAYAGGFVMALETKVNLLKMKDQIKREESRTFSTLSRDNPDSDVYFSDSSVNSRTGKDAVGNGEWSDGETLSPNGEEVWPTPPPRAHSSAATNSDEEDSAESSTDSDMDETDLQDDKGGAAGGPASRRLLRLVDRITSSSYFHRALDNKYVQKGMEFVSNTRLVLQVEVQVLSGTLVVNMPPPPSDRLWYGFRGNPRLKLTARPRVGEKEVTMVRITEWIEKKLVLEFQRVAVLPNMDDLIIPLLCSGQPERYGHNLH